MSQVATSSAPTGSGSAGRRANILDIRRSKDEFNVRRDIEIGLQPSNGREKQMPTILLYDELGLKLFEEITFLDEVTLSSLQIIWYLA